MDEPCPMLARVEALEAGQKQQSTDLKNICANVASIAESMKKLADIIPLITLAQSVRNVSVWIAPIFAAVAAVSAAVYWVLDKFHG
jgi:hypothetical protein